MTSGGGVKGRGINGRGPRSGRAPVYAAKALDADVATTLPAAGVGWFLTRPGCPTASAGFGAEPQGLGSAISRRPAGRRRPRSNGGSAWTAVIRSAPLPSCPTYGVKFRLEAAPLPRTVSGVNQNGYSGPITSVLLTSPIPAGSTRPGREFAINAQEGCPERRERTIIRVWRSHSLCLTTGERSQRSGRDRWALERVASGRRKPESCQNPRLVRPADQRSTPMAD